MTVPTWICLTLTDGHKLPVRADAIVAFPPQKQDPRLGCELYLAGLNSAPFMITETQDELRVLLGIEVKP